VKDLVSGLKGFRDLNLHHEDMRRYNELDYTTPLSPQAMKSLMVGPESSSYDKEKNDIWSLGITLLSAFVNEDFNNYYDWP